MPSTKSGAGKSTAQRKWGELTARRIGWLEWFLLLKRPSKPSAIDMMVAGRLFHYAGLPKSYTMFTRKNRVECWIGIDRLTEELGVSRRSVLTSLENLAKKFKAIETRHSRGGRGHTNHYVLPRKDPRDVLSETVQSPARNGAAHCTQMTSPYRERSKRRLAPRCADAARGRAPASESIECTWDEDAQKYIHVEQD